MINKGNETVRENMLDCRFTRHINSNKVKWISKTHEVINAAFESEAGDLLIKK